MANKSLARIIRILTGTFGSRQNELESLEANLTKFEKFIHFWGFVWQSFVRNRCPVRASALSYTTLLALIPMLAVAMSVTSMFLKSEGQDRIEVFVQQFVEHIVPAPQRASSEPGLAEEAPGVTSETNTPESTNEISAAASTNSNQVSSSPTNAPEPRVADERLVAAQKKAANYIHGFIQKTYSGTLGVTGVVVLLWTAIVMLARVEETFNDIWGVPRGRSWLSRIVLYWATITLGPLLLVGALGLASGSHFQKTRELLTVVPLLQPLISQLLPVVLVSVTFALFYKLMPNTKVQFGAALVGGVLAAVAWHLFNLFSIYLGSSAVRASKIYGSLALIPLLMLGLYAVWFIILFGAQTAYAFQNRETYSAQRFTENVNQRGREFVALRLMTCIGQRFERGLPPATIPEMSHELGIPNRLIAQVLQTLLAARLVVEVSNAETGYMPARPLEAINCHHVLLAMRATQGQELITRQEPVREEVFGEFARIQAAEKEAASSVTMLALVNRAHARLEIAAPVETRHGRKEAKPPTTPEDLTELPQEPAPSVASEAEPSEVAAVKEERPISAENISSAPPTAESSTDDNQSFPL